MDVDGTPMTRGALVSGKTSDKPRVLIADDEPAIVDLLVTFLEDEGYEVECASDGAMAFRKTLQVRPDIIVADNMMPHMDGYTLIDELAHADAKIPVIIMSAALIARRPKVPFIAKPFDLGELLDMITHELGRQSQ